MSLFFRKVKDYFFSSLQNPEHKNSAVSGSSASLWVQAVIDGWCLLHLLTGAIAVIPSELPEYLEMISPVLLLFL